MKIFVLAYWFLGFIKRIIERYLSSCLKRKIYRICSLLDKEYGSTAEHYGRRRLHVSYIAELSISSVLHKFFIQYNVNILCKFGDFLRKTLFS